MVDPLTVAQTYRENAARCRRLARQTTDREIANRLLELARELDEHAARLEQGEE
jgi:hypothetical protein